MTAPPWISSLHQFIWKVQVQMLICPDVLLCFLLPPTDTVGEMMLNSNPHSERTPQHKLPNQKFGSQQNAIHSFLATFTLSVSMLPY